MKRRNSSNFHLLYHYPLQIGRRLPFLFPMKEFSCGDVVPGCSASFHGSSDDEILSQVARHACADHGLAEVSADLVHAVKTKIRVGSAPTDRG